MKWIACAVLTVLACRGPRPAPTATAARALPAPPPFSCVADRCVQRHPRLPDDGEWTCTDQGGATICVGGERAAGVAAAPGDPAFICGARRGAPSDPLGSRICVDPTPDLPDGARADWRCRIVSDPSARRICDREPGPWKLGAGCGAQHPCAQGSDCVAGRCALPRRMPDCWFDSDCPNHRCRFGSCGATPP